jgi:hypothetical protein
LGWCLKKIAHLPRLDNDDNEKEFDEFEKNVPELVDSIMLLLTELEFRSFDEIYEENLVNELATTYFRDLIFNDDDAETNINRNASLERHKALNWVRKSMGIEE